MRYLGCAVLCLAVALLPLGCDAPAAVSDAPAAVSDAPAAVSDAPAAVSDAPAAVSDALEILEAYGRTMGTTYSVKLANAPRSLPEDWQLQIDAELRRVNDQMSTYLESSEISRFNRSESAEWFAVSPETAEVVIYALEVSEQTEGAFDVTVAPLVNVWSFGPQERTQRVPSDAEIAELKKRVGYQHLQARSDPPALRKTLPELTVDLSAIAKGHGVDRVIELLEDLGVEHAFVEIGGEVRVLGDRVDRKWGVGIQQPDGAPEEVFTALPLADAAVATSGDYRNFFDAAGQRFSHTLDPRSGKPVQHPLASVSVVAKNCMIADAWATALTVLGDQQGLATAKRLNLDVMLIVRDGEEYEIIRTGVFQTNLATANP